jgi:multidrug efflux pump subunit AcrA (membrane-fusion protein)
MTVVVLVVPSMVSAQSPRGAGGGGRSGGAPGNNGGSAVAEATVSEESHRITVAGRLEPQGRIVHRVPSAGFIDSISVREGERVTAGQELLRVRRRDDVLGLYQPVPLTARISGLVSVIHVQSEAEAAPSDAAVTILDTAGFRLIAGISDKDAFSIDPGRTVTGVTTDGREIPGRLMSRSQEPDYDTGLFEVIFQFSALPGVRIGEFVTVDLPVERTRGIFVPRDAVVRRYGSYYLWTVGSDDTISSREVELGDTFGDRVLIRSGLEVSERYLARLSGREREGTSISGEATDS